MISTPAAGTAARLALSLEATKVMGDVSPILLEQRRNVALAESRERKRCQDVPVARIPPQGKAVRERGRGRIRKRDEILLPLTAFFPELPAHYLRGTCLVLATRHDTRRNLDDEILGEHSTPCGYKKLVPHNGI